MSTLARTGAHRARPRGGGALPGPLRSRPAASCPTSEDGRRLLVALLSNGSYLADLLLADVTGAGTPAGRPLPAPAQAPRTPAAGDRPGLRRPPRDLRSLQRTLRRFARREMLRLGAREIGWGTTLEVAAELSWLADACLEEAVRVCDGELRAGYGAPQSPERPPGFVVLGMGKLGGEELNFSARTSTSSTCTPPTRARPGSLTPARVLRAPVADGDPGPGRERRRGAWCSGWTCACGPRGAAGRSATRWRRPSATTRPSGGPGSGRRCCAPARRPATWRWAHEFLRMVDPFVFPRSLGPEAVDEVLALRRLFRQAGHKLGAGFDVKLGTGRHPRRRAGGAAAAAAARRQAARAARARHLAGAAEADPGRPADRSRAAGAGRRLPLPAPGGAPAAAGARQPDPQPAHRARRHRPCWPAAWATPTTRRWRMQLERQRAAVSAVSDTLGEPASAAAGGGHAPAGSRRPRASRSRAIWPRPGFSEPAAQRRRAGAGAEPAAGRLAGGDPGLARSPTGRCWRFAELALRGSVGVFALLREHPPLLRMLASLFGTSERLSHHLLDHPNLWQPLLRRPGRTPPAAPTAGRPPCPRAWPAWTRKRRCARCGAIRPRRSCASASTTCRATWTRPR